MDGAGGLVLCLGLGIVLDSLETLFCWRFVDVDLGEAFLINFRVVGAEIGFFRAAEVKMTQLVLARINLVLDHLA